MARDIIYYEDQDIVVTSTVISVRGFTYLLKNVTSYRAVYGGGTIYTMLPFLLGLVLLALFIPPQNAIGVGIGAAMILVGIFQVFFCKTLYIVTSAEQARGYTTFSRTRMIAILRAINQAMADNR